MRPLEIILLHSPTFLNESPIDLFFYLHRMKKTCRILSCQRGQTLRKLIDLTNKKYVALDEEQAVIDGSTALRHAVYRSKIVACKSS